MTPMKDGWLKNEILNLPIMRKESNVPKDNNAETQKMEKNHLAQVVTSLCKSCGICKRYEEPEYSHIAELCRSNGQESPSGLCQPGHICSIDIHFGEKLDNGNQDGENSKPFLQERT